MPARRGALCEVSLVPREALVAGVGLSWPQRPRSRRVSDLCCFACARLAPEMGQAQVSTAGKAAPFINVSTAKLLSQKGFFPQCARSQSPHRVQVFPLFTVLHRKRCWVANPQSQPSDYQNFSRFIHKQRHLFSLATSHRVLLLTTILSSTD